MLWFLPEFSSILHPACHGRSQKLGAPASILREARWGGVGGGGVGVAGRFWGGGGGVGTKGKISRFQMSRGWHLCKWPGWKWITTYRIYGGGLFSVCEVRLHVPFDVQR